MVQPIANPNFPVVAQQNEIDAMILELGKITLRIDGVDRIKEELEISKKAILDRLASCPQSSTI